MLRVPAWTPILDGPDADRAHAAVQAIVLALRALPAERARPSAHELALLEAYLSHAADEATDEGAASRWLDLAADGVAEQAMSPALWGGFVGVAFAMEHVQSVMGLPSDAGGSDDDPNQEVDGALEELLGQKDWARDYDLVSGLVGIGVYALERLPRRAAQDAMRAVTDHLDRLAERTPDGLTWWTPPTLMIPETRARYPSGYYNLGMAHGVPGVLAVLAGAYAAGCERARVLPLVEGAASWLLAQRQPAGSSSVFPYTLSRDESAQPARCAWCYGDPGVAAALLCAARALDRPEWERAALAIARSAADRPPDQTGVVDAGLCHGAAGLAQIYSRAAQATGDPELRRAARLWLGRTLDFRRDGEGIAGYRSLSFVGGQGTWTDDPSLLTGATGIALVLLSALAPVEPGWDRLLLLSLPPARQPL